MKLDTTRPVLVAGAGIMGAGIAQVAAQAGHRVMLFDAQPGAAAEARAKLAATLDGLSAKGKLAPEEARAAAERIAVAGSLDDAANAALVMEAIVEDAQAKRALLRQLEDVVATVGPELGTSAVSGCATSIAS